MNMWNPKQELAKKAVAIAKEKHPEGFNKSQLIESSKEVYGGFGREHSELRILASEGRKSIKTMEDVSNAGNAMAFIDGGYPAGMPGCMIVGISGDCGPSCPVLREGDCNEPQEFNKEDIIYELGEEEAEKIFEMYSCFEEER